MQGNTLEEKFHICLKMSFFALFTIYRDIYIFYFVKVYFFVSEQEKNFLIEKK